MNVLQNYIINNTTGLIKFLPRDAMYKSGLCRRAVSVGLCRRVSVTFAHCVETTQHPVATRFPYQTLWQYSDRNPLIGRRMQVGYEK